MVEIPKIVNHQEKSLQFDMTFNGFILNFAFSYSMNVFTGLNPYHVFMDQISRIITMLYMAIGSLHFTGTNDFDWVSKGSNCFQMKSGTV